MMARSRRDAVDGFRCSSGRAPARPRRRDGGASLNRLCPRWLEQDGKRAGREAAGTHHQDRSQTRAARGRQRWTPTARARTPKEPGVTPSAGAYAGRQARASEAKTLASSAFCTQCGSAEGAASVSKGSMIVPEDELPPMSEVERMARREPPSQFTQPEHKLYVHRPPSALLVMVCRARDLIMCDYNWLTRTGSSDPTVKLQVEGRGTRAEQTSTQYKTLTPEWDEDFLLPCDDPEETLRVTVEDYDRFSGNDFMGCVRIRASFQERRSALKHRQLVVNTYRLTDTKGRTKKNRGVLLIYN